MTGKYRVLIAFLALGCALLSAQTASAVAVSWTVVSSASTITFNTDIGPGFAKTVPQGVGIQGLPSDTAHFDGTISGDTDGVSTLTISSGAVDAIITGVWEPAIGGGLPGSDPADYGFDLVGFATGKAATRNILFDVAKAATPVVAGAWDADDVGLTITTGDLDFNTGLTGPGTTSIAGVASLTEPGVGSLVTVGITETLTIPILIIDSTSLDLSGIPVLITISGSIVATRTIPEPGTMVMLGIGAAMLVPVAVRRYRRR
jgi:hypothetical protein